MLSGSCSRQSTLARSLSRWKTHVHHFMSRPFPPHRRAWAGHLARDRRLIWFWFGICTLVGATRCSALVLVGRRGLQTPGARSHRNTDCTRHSNHGESVRYFKEQAVKVLMADLKDIAPSIQGVLHAAAQFDDRLLMQLDAESVTRVVDAKFLGAWNLHNATLHLPLTHLFCIHQSLH